MRTTFAAFTIASAASMAPTSPRVSIMPRAIWLISDSLSPVARLFYGGDCSFDFCHVGSRHGAARQLLPLEIIDSMSPGESTSPRFAASGRGGSGHGPPEDEAPRGAGSNPR